MTTAIDGKSYKTKYYSLDVIISVGYRVKSLRGTQFRIWANSVLKEYLKKGFAMNDDLLKRSAGGNYFKELLERIRDIRSNEKIFYWQILEIYATSIDYDPNEESSKLFFKTVQIESEIKLQKYVHDSLSKVYFELNNSPAPFYGLQQHRLVFQLL